MKLKSAFINEFGRVRSGWRFFVYLFLVFMLGGSVLAAAIAVAKAASDQQSVSGLLPLILNFGVMIPFAIGFAWLCGKLFEDLPFRALGCWFTKSWFRHLILGLVGGAASVCLAAAISWIFGGMTFRINDQSGIFPMFITLSTTLAVFTLGAAFEEVLFRGYPLQTFSRARLAFVGVIVTSLLFATTHNGNPNASPLSWFNTFLAGLWFCAAYFKTRDLWFAFGLHLTWNWFQGAVLGIPVSGLTELAPAPMMRATDHGPVWLTGGTYGLEAGIACTVALAVSIVAIKFAPGFRPQEEMLRFSSTETETAKQEQVSSIV